MTFDELNNERGKAWAAFKKNGFSNQMSDAFDLAWNTAYRLAWDAATEEVKKDHFKIGEEVEWAWDSENWTKGHVGIMVNKSNPEPRVRRIPAWEPKNGEPVLAKNKSGYVFSAFSAGDNKIYLPDGIAEAYDVKPFKPLCDGKPWDEV